MLFDYLMTILVMDKFVFENCSCVATVLTLCCHVSAGRYVNLIEAVG
jgi:hypothetical protein